MGDTILHFAAFHGNLSLVKYILAGDSDINIKNSVGFSP